MLVNGRRITSPSYATQKGDVLTVREGSRRSPLFAGLTEEGAVSSRALPQWISLDRGALKIEVTGEPIFTPAETLLDYPTVFEFYSR